MCQDTVQGTRCIEFSKIDIVQTGSVVFFRLSERHGHYIQVNEIKQLHSSGVKEKYSMI